MKRFLDLTHPIEKGMPVFPGDPQPEFTESMTLDKDICTVQTIRFNNHIGTHLDAPSHFIDDGITVDQIPLETLMGKAVLMDFTGKRKRGLITKEEADAVTDVVRHISGVRRVVRVFEYI